MCYSVIFASAYTSAWPLSLKQNGVFTLVTTSAYTDSHTAHSTHSTHFVRHCLFHFSVMDVEEAVNRNGCEQ